MKLFGNVFSPRYHRVVIAAAELAVPLELIDVNPVRGENRKPEYLSKNPMGKMPTFEDDDGWTLWESCAVILYLADKYPKGDLLPVDLRGRANALRWLFWSTAHLDPSVAQLYSQKFLGPLRGRTPDAAVVTGAKKELDRYLPVLEDELKNQQWILGSKFSLVDVALGVSVDTVFQKEIEIDTAPYPNLFRWREDLVKRPTWSRVTFGK